MTKLLSHVQESEYLHSKTLSHIILETVIHWKENKKPQHIRDLQT